MILLDKCGMSNGIRGKRREQGKRTEGRGENKRQTPNNNAGGNGQETKDKIQK
jgi:hypothetical protein